MRIMGIDPGSLCTGYGIIEQTRKGLVALHWGAIRNPPKTAFPDRLKAVYDGLSDVLREYSPDTAAIEDLFFATNAKSTIKLGQARGVAILAAVNAGVELVEYTPLAVKQAVVSYGRADKDQVREMVTTLLGLKTRPEPLDASDALAVAICHAHSHRMNAHLKTSAAR